MRRLIWVPIVHSQVDLGSVGELLKSLYDEKIGKREWKRHTEAVEDMWHGIRSKIDQLELDCGKLRLYQDGLPNCGRESEIVRDLAKAGSQNHQILVDLMAKGAELVGTESPELLLEEYKLVQQMLKCLLSGGMDYLCEQRRADLLRERDRYIGKRIDETLHHDEMGLAFLGFLHSLREYLRQDIHLVTLAQATEHNHA